MSDGNPNSSADEAENSGREDEGDWGIIPALQASAKIEKKKRPRGQSEAEREWCRSLVEKYGDDWGGMRRERKLIPYQQGEGELKRRLGFG